MNPGQCALFFAPLAAHLPVSSRCHVGSAAVFSFTIGQQVVFFMNDGAGFNLYQ